MNRYRSIRRKRSNDSFLDHDLRVTFSAMLYMMDDVYRSQRGLFEVEVLQFYLHRRLYQHGAILYSAKTA